MMISTSRVMLMVASVMSLGAGLMFLDGKPNAVGFGMFLAGCIVGGLTFIAEALEGRRKEGRDDDKEAS